MRTIVLTAVLAMAALAPHRAVTQPAVRCDAPIGQVQPTVIGVQRAQAAKGGLSATDIQVDEEIQRNEQELRNKLTICRRC